jgi:hypothetical protein
VEERDIWRTAHLLMKQHGDDAECVAAQRADALLAEGDHLGSSVFIKVGHAIEALRREKPDEGESVN